jgi:alpha-galactosidase
MAVGPVCSAVSVSPEELAEARQWSAAKFEGANPEPVRQPALVVLANHDPVIKNSRGGQPLRLGDQQYTHGLYCHAFSKIHIQLPGPGASFSAIVGVDSNEQTSGGRGSVDFSVQVGGAEKFRSGVLHEGTPAKTVEVPLHGASEFFLQVDETPDGISCDQADWAEAKVTLQNGTTLWLADLPLLTSARVPWSNDPPFSFLYDGQPSAKLLKDWNLVRSSKPLDAQRTQYTLTWTEPQHGLQVRCEAVAYADYPTVEWTLYFKNTGQSDTPMLSEFCALDTRIAKEGAGAFTLHHHKGTFVRADDFEPLTSRLAADEKLRFVPPAGRPLGHVFPFFNLEQPAGDGLIVVLGWPGQWFAEFNADHSGNLHLTGGQERTHFALHPGEEYRTPLVVLQFWRGDWLRAQNIWRRWMWAHNVPQPGGKPLAPTMEACSSHQFGEMINANEENQKLFVDRYLEEKLPLDYWWMDAGWYFHYGDGWPRTGTWEVDTGRFPHGLRAITDHAHTKGVKSIVWFEPERVTPGTFLYTNNPAWLLGKDGEQKLLNLGHPEAWQWLVDHVSKTIREQGIDLYRQDYNVDPLAYWRGAETTNRQGLVENHYVSGYLAYWDELLRRFPGMLIDTCASGGHRNDLETLRRSVPLLRSDYILEPIGQQCHTYGLAFWMPFYGTGVNAMDAYTFRSAMSPSLNTCFDMRRKDLPFDEVRRLLTQWKNEIAPNYFGDFYPLTPYTTSDDAWLAWQFDRPEAGQGLVQVFRRANSVYESARLKLHGLDARTWYTVTNLDHPSTSQKYFGRELAEKGLLVTASDSPSALVFSYRRSP